MSESNQNTPDSSGLALARILKIRVPLIVVLAQTKMWMNKIVELSPGTVVEFDKSCNDPLLLLVNNRVVAEGEAVKVGENFGLRLTRVGSREEIIKNLGP